MRRSDSYGVAFLCALMFLDVCVIPLLLNFAGDAAFMRLSAPVALIVYLLAGWLGFRTHLSKRAAAWLVVAVPVTVYVGSVAFSVIWETAGGLTGVPVYVFFMQPDFWDSLIEVWPLLATWAVGVLVGMRARRRGVEQAYRADGAR